MGEVTAAIAIPTDLYERMQKRLEKENFESVDKYAEYILDRVLTELENIENKK